MQNEKMPLPLEGIKVVELATVVAAPVVGRLLAHFGAEVIKIETPPIGDQLRRTGGMYNLPEEDGNNPIFDVFNSGKKIIALNLKTEEGKKVLFKLLEEADVLTSNVRMDSLKRLGLGYEVLKEKFPKLIYAHLSGYGLNGPVSKMPGYDHTTFWLRSGVLNDWPAKGDFPLSPTYGFGDEVTAVNLAFGILAALYGRQKTGVGTMVTISLYGTGIWCNATNIMSTQEQFGYELPAEKYTKHPFANWYLCADGKWIYILGKYEYGRDKKTYAEMLGIPELLTDPRAETMDTLRESGALKEFAEKAAASVRKKSSQEWAEILRSNDIAFGVESHFKDVCKDEQAWANGYLENVEYPCGTVAVPKVPVQLSAYEEKPFRIAGAIGEHTDEVLEALGYSKDQIRSMREAGAVL